MIEDRSLEALTPPSLVHATRLPKPVPKAEDKTAKLLGLANLRLPKHDCDSRREILKARAELERSA